MPLNGLQQHYLDEGSGKPVVMLHGNPTWSFYYRRLVQALSPRFRTIAPDHIGCGLSDKPGPSRYEYRLQRRITDLETLIDLLGLKQKITLVLHDWGGIIGIAYALRHLDKIDRIVLMNTAAFLPPANKKLPLRLRLIRNIKPLAKPAVLGLNLFAVAALYMASHKGLSAEVKAGLTAPYNCWGNRIATLKFVEDIPLSPDDPSYETVKNVDENLHKLSDIPLLILWGEHDFVFDRSYLEEWQRRFPDAEVHSFSDAGHYVLEDEPEETIRLVDEFLMRDEC
jgi:pimeloyl-ACP methyl ester carboxylesterase